MIRLIPLALLCTLLVGCKSMEVNCAKADKVRAAAAVALATLDRVCPITYPQ
ncbi:hypothetical protein HHL26_06775 [Sphingobium sp. TB-6]|uniref:hypothetical protein n=1 Tax=Sphingobium sp. TB-6 TaxID=2728850 RepID=UPI00146C065E|nr:hypothetical protein [Sphingobium sp. TB-6]NML88770.1 hypothetical protein [Sphingobium sp. TB-6]